MHGVGNNRFRQTPRWGKDITCSAQAHESRAKENVSNWRSSVSQRIRGLQNRRKMMALSLLGSYVQTERKHKHSCRPHTRRGRGHSPLVPTILFSNLEPSGGSWEPWRRLRCNPNPHAPDSWNICLLRMCRVQKTLVQSTNIQATRTARRGRWLRWFVFLVSIISEGSLLCREMNT